MHKVTRPEDPEKSCLPCRVNPMHLICTCKGSRKTGICSHIIAVNARCHRISITSELMHSARKKNSKKTKHRQATGRHQMQPESESEPESEIDDTLDDWHSSEDEDWGR